MEETKKDDELSVSGSQPSGKKKGGLAKIIAIIIILLLIALGVYRAVTVQKKEVPADVAMNINVAVQTVGYGNIQTTTPLTGKIEPKDQVTLNASLQAKVTDVFVQEGDYVTAGTTLFTLDATQVQSAYSQASSSLENAQNGLATAKLNLDRMQALFSEGAVSSQALEQAQSSYDQAVQAVNQAQASVSSAGNNLQNGSVTAPISGYVTEINVKKGAFPPTGQVAAAIADTTHLEIKTNVSEYLIGKIKEGQPVDVVINALSEQPFKAHIATIAPAPATNALTYPITISIDANQPGIKAGMFAQIQIVSDHAENVLVIPSESVLIRSGESRVVTLDQENKPAFTPVETGLDNGQFVEIKSGLNAGDVIVTAGQDYVTEGEPVNIVEQLEN